MRIPFTEIDIPGWAVGVGCYLLFSGKAKPTMQGVHTPGRIFSDLVSQEFNDKVTRIAQRMARDENNKEEVNDIANGLMVNFKRESDFNPMAHANQGPDIDPKSDTGQLKWHYGLTDENSINQYTQGGGMVGFMKPTAKNLWKKKKIYYTSEQEALDRLLHLTREEQLDFVWFLLEPFAGKLGNDPITTTRLIFFRPATFRDNPDGISADTVLYSKKENPKQFHGNKGLDLNHDDIITAGEMTQKAYETYEDGIKRMGGSKKKAVR